MSIPRARVECVLTHFSSWCMVVWQVDCAVYLDLVHMVRHAWQLIFGSYGIVSFFRTELVNHFDGSFQENSELMGIFIMYIYI